jgi:hypothetical protein
VTLILIYRIDMHLTFPFTILAATAVYMGLPQARNGVLELIVLLVDIPS